MTIESLRQYSPSVEEGLKRCMNNEAFYINMVNLALSDANFARLEEAVTSGDLTTGFEAAHALKGMVGNLSLGPLYDAIVDITELLRSRSQVDYAPFLAALRRERETLQNLA